MATRVDWSHFSLAQLNGRPRKHPTEKESLTYYLRYKPCYGQFCVMSLFVTVSTRVGLAKISSQHQKTAYSVQKCGVV